MIAAPILLSNILDNSSVNVHNDQMSAIWELSEAVRARRADMGLTQTRLAELSGLSRSTVNQLEQGTIKDLSLTRAGKLLNVLGMTIGVTTPRAGTPKSAKTPPMTLAARTASVSYREPMTAGELHKILRGSTIPASRLAHMRSLLDEAPVSLLASVAEQIAAEDEIGAVTTWRRMRQLAHELRLSRPIWHDHQT